MSIIVHLAGHLGKDPEVRFTPSGQKVSSFTVATNQRKGKEDVTIWVRVTVWGDRFDKLISFLKKGSAVMVTGKMMPASTYEKEGKVNVTYEVTAEMIEFSPFGKGGGDREGQQQSQSNHNTHSYDQSSSEGGKSSYATTYGQGNNYSNSNDEDPPF